MEKKLYRDEQNKMVGGVCAGLAQYLDMDVTVVRLLFAFAFFVAGVGGGTYIILWIVLPRKTYNPFTTPSDPATVNYIVPPVIPVNPGQPFTPVPQKRSNGGIIVGLVLILMGAVFLLHQLDLFSFWELHRFWPVLLVGVGIALIVSGQRKKPWEHHDWNNVNQTKAPESDALKTDNSTNDNNPTV
jgi:phage shock protein PspC (stress-responsive transcriptional regulator)